MGETSRVSTHPPVVMRKLSDEQGPLEKGHMAGGRTDHVCDK